MALYKTQCPHCFTNYVISDEQMRASDGMVRCGRCRETFRADVERQSVEKQRGEKQKEERQTTPPKFDPKKASIEPFSQTPFEQTAHTTQVSIEYASEVEQASSLDSDDLTVDEIVANINAKQERQREQAKQKETKPATSTPNRNAAPKPVEQTDIPEFLEKRSSGASKPKPNTKKPDIKSSESSSRDEQLINQMDALIEDKIINKKLSEEKASTQEFSLDDRQATSASGLLKKLGGGFISAVFLSALLFVLIYQAWLKQWIVFDRQSSVEQWFSNGSIELNKIANEYGFELPQRQNLSRLELLSAKVEAHPSRSSTVLLRVSMVNHAGIAQVMPWLELSLFDKEGRLVARRQLPPEDYLYNNTSSIQIGARELKKFSIELLAFPKNATGYELRLLNRT